MSKRGFKRWAWRQSDPERPPAGDVEKWIARLVLAGFLIWVVSRL